MIAVDEGEIEVNEKVWDSSISHGLIPIWEQALTERVNHQQSLWLKRNQQKADEILNHIPTSGIFGVYKPCLGTYQSPR